MTDPIDWTDTTPLRLKDAAALAFPNGGMTPSGLRREAERGRLVIERIAGKDYVTMKAIAEMRKKCFASSESPILQRSGERRDRSRQILWDGRLRK